MKRIKKKKKEKNTYVCNDKILLVMILGCTHTNTHIDHMFEITPRA